ncbi:protein of unknown function [Candidatus Methylomirabilis oxygeniifera]|uniref:Uncharacterized protein n=1 Tax=Methylomirabilis oxygeniifera TaxID=671143 RepID=D5MHA2_METO1|nr:protein of unknown function [Candidatus Methylomirabilis oxyfera]
MWMGRRRVGNDPQVRRPIQGNRQRTTFADKGASDDRLAWCCQVVVVDDDSVVLWTGECVGTDDWVGS